MRAEIILFWIAVAGLLNAFDPKRVYEAMDD